jgi:membrane associated rhomboid family serine protease
VAASEKTAVKVDVCRTCHLVWFDPNEFETLTPQPSTGHAELPPKAREILALARVEQIAKDAEGPDFDSAPPDEWWKGIAVAFGIPVEFDAPQHERTAWITWILGAAMIGAMALAYPRLEEIIQQFGLIPAQALRYGGLTFITAFFLHGGIFHLIGNAYFLLVFGDDVENFLGPIRYLLLLAMATFVGDLAHIAFDPHSVIPCVGASGGIAGVITFYALNFPEIRLGFRMAYRWIRLPAWFVFILWFLFQFVGSFEQFIGFTSVSHIAHLGGALVGLAAWWLWRDSEYAPV